MHQSVLRGLSGADVHWRSALDARLPAAPGVFDFAAENSKGELHSELAHADLVAANDPILNQRMKQAPSI